MVMRRALPANPRSIFHKDASCKLTGAQQPTRGFLGQRRLALTAEAGDGDASRLAGKSPFDLPQLAAAADKPGLGLVWNVAALRRRLDLRVRLAQKRHIVASRVQRWDKPITQQERHAL